MGEWALFEGDQTSRGELEAGSWELEAMTKISRRELAKLAAGVAAARALPLSAQAPAVPPYIGPLTGVEKGIEGRKFDPVAYTLDLYADAPRRLRFQARSRSQAEAWQKQLRVKVAELVGGFPAERTPLRPVTLETRTFPGYRREKFVFDSTARRQRARVSPAAGQGEVPGAPP